MRHFTVTYGIVTPESAERMADYETQGFVLPGDWKVELPAHVCGQEAGAVKAECMLTLREAIALVNTACLYDNGSALYEQDERRDYKTGASETRALHIADCVTGASYRRISKLVCGAR